MITLTWPDEAEQSYHSYDLVFPGQENLRGPYGGGGVQVVGRGPGYWVGEVDIRQRSNVKPGNNRIIRAITTFIRDLEGFTNFMEIPLFEPSAGTLAAGTTLTVTIAPTVNGGRLRVGVAGAAAGLVKGDMVRYGVRLYQLTEDMADGNLVMIPAVIPPDDPLPRTIVWEDVTVKAKLREPIEVFRRIPSFTGPFQLVYEEALQ